MEEEKIRTVIDKLSEPGTYKNLREIDIGGIPYSMRDVLITAPLIAGLNVYLVGGTGEGKTQLANDLAGYFGDSYCYAEGRPDFEPSEILKQLNLGKLKDVSSDRELIELTENVRKALYYVDEMNRCPPIIQNYFFNFFDGKLVHNGKILSLGKDGYSVGYASGNLGNGEYVGVEDSDRALKDRMHLIIKLDHPDFCTTEGDDYDIFRGKKNPRATLPKSDDVLLDDILELHKVFTKREVPSILPFLGVYFHKGLDYLENTKKNSKRAIDSVWPNIDGIKQETDESKIMPLSKRSILAAIGLTEALAMIAQSREHKVKDSTSLFLDALRFTIPYSGVLAPQYVHNEKSGDVYAAFDDVMDGIRIDINSKKEALETASAFALCGEVENSVLDEICPVVDGGKWAPVRRAIENLASREPSVDPTVLENIREEYKEVA